MGVPLDTSMFDQTVRVRPNVVTTDEDGGAVLTTGVGTEYAASVQLGNGSPTNARYMAEHGRVEGLTTYTVFTKGTDGPPSINVDDVIEWTDESRTLIVNGKPHPIKDGTYVISYATDCVERT